MRTIGTIVPLKKLLFQDHIILRTQLNEDGYEQVELSADRSYYVPYYQREIRWQKENMIMLLRDIQRSYGGKMIGNIVLNEELDESGHATKRYEIIDGQQRFTALTMIIDFLVDKDEKIRENFPTEVCQFGYESFLGFQNIREQKYSLQQFEDLDSSDWKELDPFEQRFILCDELYATIENFFSGFDSSKCQAFFEKLINCEANIVISRNENNAEKDCEKATEFFLDINLKAKPLDAEDKFKAYYFKNIRPLEDAKKSWIELKQAYSSYLLSYREAKKYDIVKAQREYSLLEMIEHIFRCTLYNQGEEKYQKIEFNSSFEIMKEINDASLFGEVKYVGEHLIEVLQNETKYIRNTIKLLTKYLDLLSHMFGGGIPSELKRLFKTRTGKKLDSVVQNLIFHEMKNILLGSNVVPKAVLMKYYVTVLDNKIHEVKEYKKMHAVYFFGTIYSVFTVEKKVIASIETILKANSEDWAWLAICKGRECLQKEKFGESLDYLKYKVTKLEESHQFLAKSLATVFNFYKMNERNRSIQVNSEKKAEKFISNREEYSIEHFFINEGKSIRVIYKDQEKVFQYKDVMTTASVFRHSIFNFIFIPEKINSNVLENYQYTKKAALLEESNYNKLIKCDYTKRVLSVMKEENFGDDRNETFDFIEISDLNESDIVEAIKGFFSKGGKFYIKYKQFAEKMYKIVAQKVLSNT